MRATSAEKLVEAGRAALARGSWDSARDFFSRAIAIAATPAAYEGLGVAARYALDADVAFAAHEEGFRLARAAGEPDTAARLAVQLAYDAYAFRGVAEAVGWGERAAMLVEGRAPSVASAYVPFVRAYMALLAQHDPPTAISSASEAVRIAKEVGAVDVELLSVALGGLAMVASGRVADGMARLDAAAAAAVGGEMTDADSIETVCCFVIDACKRVRDLERANEWCLRVREIAHRFGDRQMFTVCRVHYADVLMWRGDLADAEAELEAAVAELGRLRPGRDADAIVRLAELRRRQGRTSEVAALLERATTHRLHALVEGVLALERGDAASACEAADRFLRRVGETDRFERVAGLELQVCANLATGDFATAARAATELDAIAETGINPALRAAALLARARLKAASGDAPAAVRFADDAADLFDGAGARYDAALARGELARCLRQAGEEQRARRAETAAADALAALGAATAGARNGALSVRETEVLRLVATGLSNDEIAARLVLSVRTVERHVANVYAKIGASGRTARAVATAWAHTNGIA